MDGVGTGYRVIDFAIGVDHAVARSTPVFLDTGHCHWQLRRVAAFGMVYRADDDAALHSVTTTALAERFAREPVGRLACLRCLFISADGWWLYRPTVLGPLQAFSSPKCAEAKVEFRQCLNGTMLGSYQYPNCQ